VHPVDHHLGQIEHGRLRPVEVLQDHDERAVGRHHLEHPPHRPWRVAAERLAHAEELREAVRHGRTVRLPRQALPQRRGDLPRLARRPLGHLRQQLHERRERHALAVGGCLSDHDGGALADRPREGLAQTRFPDARRSQDRDEHARARIGRISERALQHRELTRAPHERGLRPRGVREETQDAPGDHTVALALELERPDSLGLHLVAHHAPGGVADQDVSRLGGRLQTRGRVHRVRDDVLVAGGHEHLPRGHADPRREPDRRAVVQRSHPPLHLERRADRPKGVVLMGGGEAEHRDDRVPDELLHLSPVTLHRSAHLVEVAPEDRPQDLRIVPLAEARRAHEVAEQGGHELASLDRGLGRGQRGAARHAERGRRRVLRGTRRAPAHQPLPRKASAARPAAMPEPIAPSM
jgi:hypothetical protein